MRLTVIILALLLCGLTYGGEEFRVEELTSQDVSRLDRAEQEVSRAIKELAKASARLEKAKENQKKVKRQVLHEYQVSEFGGCDWNSGSVSARYSKVEIRGTYILITEGTERCSNLTWTTDNLGHVGSGSISSVLEAVPR
jgi:hypothetical protein